MPDPRCIQRTGNRGGGHTHKITGRKYPENVTAGVTQEHIEWLDQFMGPGRSRSDVIRACIEHCRDTNATLPWSPE